MKRGEAWWVSFGQSVGGEIRKNRPAVVITNDIAIVHLNRIQVVPLTTNVSRVYPGETIIMVNRQPHKAMADQLTTISKSRVSNIFGELSNDDIEKVEAAVRLQLGLR